MSSSLISANAMPFTLLSPHDLVSCLIYAYQIVTHRWTDSQNFILKRKLDFKVVKLIDKIIWWGWVYVSPLSIIEETFPSRLPLVTFHLFFPHWWIYSLVTCENLSNIEMNLTVHPSMLVAKFLVHDARVCWPNLRSIFINKSHYLGPANVHLHMLSPWSVSSWLGTRKTLLGVLPCTHFVVHEAG